jgi:UDP-glucose 4-epimerase
MKILVCGGAGYIGSHMCKWLAERNYEVTVLDNLSTGHKEAVQWGELIQADIRNPDQLEHAFVGRNYDAVMHFCAMSLVGESVHKAYEYYENNVSGSLNLLTAMRRHQVNRLVFSSTAAVFGNPVSDFIDESHPKSPINPYGASKLMVERILDDAATAYGLNSVALRYFNAAGAAEDGCIGESHSPETHLIPNVLRQALGQGNGLKLFGEDYPTPDGTCIRDYVHVDDLAQAHEAALTFMQSNPGAHAFNLGNGTGYSVKQVIQAASRLIGRDIPCESAPRRAGDPPVLVASSAAAQTMLCWKPAYADLDDIIHSAWRWHQNPRF